MPRLASALIFVKDLPRMAAFYQHVLGLSPVSPGQPVDGFMEFDAGGDPGLTLHAIPAHLAAGIHIASPPVPRSENPVKLIFEVDDLAAEQLRLAAFGVTLTYRPWGALDGVDPEGNVFQIRPALRVSQ
jgi:catechol 2,3-dioxygenase-like lactoylglutathione lyase family enzyme